MRALPFVILSLASAVACRSSGMPASETASMSHSGPTATATVVDASGRELGVLTIMEMGGGLHATGTLRGLPAGTHGMHLHAVGRCEAPFTSAGGHWNPAMRQHGFENPDGSHAGDMPNITANTDGVASVNVMTRSGTLRGANPAMDADGTAVVVHAGADDYRTDPSGNSGDRIACGVVRGAM